MKALLTKDARDQGTVWIDIADGATRLRVTTVTDYAITGRTAGDFVGGKEVGRLQVFSQISEAARINVVDGPARPTEDDARDRTSRRADAERYPEQAGS